MRAHTVPQPQPLRRFGLEWLALSLLLLVLAGLIVQALLRERQETEAAEAERLQGQARVIDDNLIRQLEGVNNALLGIRADFARLAPGTPPAALSVQLELLSRAMPGVRTLSILDASGTIVASSRANLVGISYAKSENFSRQRQQPDPNRLSISRPFRSLQNLLIVVVGRVLTGPGGEFAGVVNATLDPEYFEVVLRSVIYAGDMRTTLIHGDGQVFLNMPADAATLGADLAAPGSVFSRHRQSAQPATLAQGALLAAGEDRMVALRTITRADLAMNRPLVAAVSRDRAAIFQPWQAKAWRAAALFLLGGLGGAAVLHFSQRRRRVFDRLSEAAASERQRDAERLERALRGADLGLWELHLPSHTLAVNDHEREMFGWTENDSLPSGIEWRERVHPDDRAALQAAIEPHFRGETESYECEHRLQHRDGRWLWVLSRAAVIERDAAGQPLRLLGTHLDITERKRAEAELASAADQLRRSEEQLRQVTDNLPALVSCWDREQRFTFANRAYREWLGIEPAALIGRSLREVYGEQAHDRFGHHVDAALAGDRVVYRRVMATSRGPRQVEAMLVPQASDDGRIDRVYALIQDITARHEAEVQRALSEERLSLALEGSGLALFDWDLVQDVVYHSAQAAALLGEPAMAGTTSPTEMRKFVHPDDLPPMLVRIRDTLSGAATQYSAEFRIRRRGGDWIWLRARGRVVERDAQARAVRLAGTYADISERKAIEQQLRHLAEFDTLTDLPNRRLFHDRLQQAMLRAARKQPMALLFLDIDHFKSINDTLGHEAGDQVLKTYAQRMRQAVRHSDTVARLSGDEFTIILEGLRDAADARVLAAKLVDTLREPVLLAGRPTAVTDSIGMVMCVAGETDDAALLRRADDALYQAKRLGRNRYYCADADADGAEPRPVAAGAAPAPAPAPPPEAAAPAPAPAPQPAREVISTWGSM